MTGSLTWLAPLLATNAPALPPSATMQLASTLGWSLVLAAVGVSMGAALAVLLGRRWPVSAGRWLAAALLLWCWLPGVWSPDHWLGLAFHAPSLSALGLSLVVLQRRLWPASGPAPVPPATAATEGAVLAVAVLLGYALLLDAFAVLPWQLYAWGFSPMLLLAFLALALLPWVLRGGLALQRPALWLVPAALLCFALTRLPTGNLWDAVLDPWLWLLLQVLLVRRLGRYLGLYLGRRRAPAATRG